MKTAKQTMRFAVEKFDDEFAVSAYAGGGAYFTVFYGTFDECKKFIADSVKAEGNVIVVWGEGVIGNSKPIESKYCRITEI